MFEESKKETFPHPEGGNHDHATGDDGTRESVWSSPGGMAQIFLDAVLIIMSCVSLYWGATTRTRLDESASLQAEQYNLMSRRLDSSDEQFARVSGELKVTSEKLGLTTEELARAKSLTASIRKQQQQAVSQLNDALAQKASAEDMSRMQADADQRMSTLSGDLIRTNEALTGTKGELSGAIARTHDELITLAHKTDRDYYEFKLSRKGAKEKVGGVTIQLDKTDTKRNRFTVYLNFDDKRVQQRDRGFMEPVLFYVGGASSPVELVVNKLGKASISGYLSTPRGLYAGMPNVLSERPGA